MPNYMYLLLSSLLRIATVVYGYQCTETNEVTLSVIGSSATSVSSGCYSANNTKLYECYHLQSALQYIVDSATDVECHIFYIQLAIRLQHVISEPISTRSSVYITSSSKTEEQAIIRCEYNASGVDGLHSIYFNQSNSVTISNVTMERCPLPLRLFQVQEVKIESAIFR